MSVVCSLKKKRFECRGQKTVAINNLSNSRQNEDSVDVFKCKLEKLVTKAFSRFNGSERDETVLGYFMRGLNSNIVQRMKLNDDCFSDAYSDARGYESMLETLEDTKRNFARRQTNPNSILSLNFDRLNC